MEKQWKMLKKHRDIELPSTDSERKKLVSESNYHTYKQISEHLFKRTKKKFI